MAIIDHAPPPPPHPPAATASAASVVVYEGNCGPPGRNPGHIDLDPGSTTFDSGRLTVGKGTGHSIAYVATPKTLCSCDGYGSHDGYCDGDEDVSIDGTPGRNTCEDSDGMYSCKVQCECRDDDEDEGGVRILHAPGTCYVQSSPKNM